MPLQKIVVRYRDGQMMKGHTTNFFPSAPTFMLEPEGAAPGSPPVSVSVRELKAVFFVKDFAGQKGHVKRNAFAGHQPYEGRRIKVTFTDGETMLGATPQYDGRALGFFVFPADMDANTTKAFIVNGAIRAVEFPQPAIR